MKVLVVLSLAAVACESAELLRYPNIYGGFSEVYLGSNLGGYISNDIHTNFLPYELPSAIPLVKDVTPEEAAPEPVVSEIETPASVSFKAVVPSPLTLKTLAHSPITLKTVTASTYTLPSMGTYPFTLQGVAPSPLAYRMASMTPIASMAPIESRYHAQDEFGQYSFSFAGGPTSRAETRDAFGVVRGSYNYVDSEGQVQTQHYVADSLGFRVAGTNLPVIPDTAPVDLPQPVQYTPEVAAARADFEAAYNKAVGADDSESRKKRSIAAVPTFSSSPRFSYAFSSPLHYSHPSPLSHRLPFSAFPVPSTYNVVAAGINAYTGVPAITPYVAVAAPPVVGGAELTKVVHNPNHATSYRVD